MGKWYMKAGIKWKGDNKATKQQSHKTRKQRNQHMNNDKRLEYGRDRQY